MSIYKKLLDAAEDGIKFKIDLKEKNLIIGNEKLVEKGVVCSRESLIEIYDLANVFGAFPLDILPWERIETLYHNYKVSVPKEKSKCNKSYFKAKAVDNLTLKEMVNGFDRDFAQAMLEGYILLASLEGWLHWDHQNKWYWQSKNDKELVVLRDWI